MRKLLMNKFILLFLLIPSVCWGAVDLDGTDDVLCKEDADLTNLPTTVPFSVTAWANLDTFADNESFITFGEASGTDSGFRFSLSGSDELEMGYLGNTTLATTTFSVPTGEDIFIAAACQSDHDCTFWLYTPSSGTWTSEEVTTGSSMNTVASNSEIIVGARTINSSNCTSLQSFLDGTIYHLRLYDVELSDQEVRGIGGSRLKRIYVRPSGLVLDYSFDDSPSGAVVDGSTFRNNVDLTNALTADAGANSSLVSVGGILSYP